MIKRMAAQLCPPIVWNGLSDLKAKVRSLRTDRAAMLDPLRIADPEHQDVSVYWDPEMAKVLETWGEGTVWHELKFLAATLEGRILDLACGIGKNIEDLEAVDGLEAYGCDISDLLISKAVERGISPSRLRVCDARQTGYDDKSFDYSYSIGSLEHFTESELEEVLVEIGRITKRTGFHMVPVSTSGIDEGWIKTTQSYYCNSVQWWERKFRPHFDEVQVLDSLWKGQFTRGVWLVCR